MYGLTYSLSIPPTLPPRSHPQGIRSDTSMHYDPTHIQCMYITLKHKRDNVPPQADPFHMLGTGILILPKTISQKTKNATTCLFCIHIVNVSC